MLGPTNKHTTVKKNDNCHINRVISQSFCMNEVNISLIRKQIESKRVRTQLLHHRLTCQE